MWIPENNSFAQIDSRRAVASFISLFRLSLFRLSLKYVVALRYYCSTATRLL